MIAVVREEIWSVSLERVQAFFRRQKDVTEETANIFHFLSCRIILTELEPGSVGVWASKRIRLRIEGEPADVENIYHRYFLQFLSAGG